jgi:hypothetical protein
MYETPDPVTRNDRNTTPIIAGVFGLIALAVAILGALVFVDHINLAGTNQAASVQQQEQKSPAVNPTSPATAPNAAPASQPKETPPAKSN